MFSLESGVCRLESAFNLAYRVQYRCLRFTTGRLQTLDSRLESQNLFHRRIRVSLPAGNFTSQTVEFLGCGIRLQGLQNKSFPQQLEDAPARYCMSSSVSGFGLRMKVTIA